MKNNFKTINRPMEILSYICVGLSIFSLLLVLKVIQYKEKKIMFRYHGITAKRRRNDI